MPCLIQSSYEDYYKTHFEKIEIEASSQIILWRQKLDDESESNAA